MASFHRKTTFALGVMLVVSMWATTAHAQPFGGNIKVAKKWNLLLNKSIYVVIGNIQNAGDNYNVKIEILDNTNTPIASCTKTIHVNNGAGVWGYGKICSAGGVKVRATLINKPGRGMEVLPDFDIVDLGSEPSPLPAGIGACCTAGDGPPCLDLLTSAECALFDGTYHDGLECEAINDCPSVSTWGVLVLSLLVFGAGASVIQRRNIKWLTV